MIRLSLDGLVALHERLINQFSSCSEKDLRIQYHPELSPLGWHLGHIAFIEQYWLREIVLGDNSRTADLHQYFFPEMIDKSVRGELPGITDFLQLQNDFSGSENLLSELLSGNLKHPLLENGYIGWFLLQHGQQHLETMQMALHQKSLNARSASTVMARTFASQKPVSPAIAFSEGLYEVGSSTVLACDNEQPVHEVRLSSFQISEKPVNNAEYLGFMLAAGYENKNYWSRAGWLWISGADITAPEYWLHDGSGNWQVMSVEGVSEIDADAAVSGLSWYEADAFARYAGHRLPHEHEWEVAMKADSALLHSTGKVWEWCANAFFPYRGFRAFPYERYSAPWFDNNHYTLKGNSQFTGETVCRASFRNFYQPDKRHIISGLRLACDTLRRT